LTQPNLFHGRDADDRTRRVLLKRLNLNPDRMRLLASLSFNFIAKVPGLVAAFVILPMVSRSLGTATYGEFLSALALGSAFTLPYGGINAVGRRLLAAAYGARDQARQANVFVTTTLLMAAVALVAAIVLSVTTGGSWSKPVFLLIALLPIVASFFNVFDNSRASYNEHYVTALFQLIFQICIYAGVYIVGLPQGGIAVAGLTLQSPYALASIATLLVLLVQRPFLLSGKVEGVTSILVPAVGVMLADGALAVLLNLSVYWLQFSHHADMAAWFGTFVRLFQSFMSPVLLIFFPLTTYISMRWGQMTPQRQVLLHQVFIVTGFTYGLIVGGAMAFFGPLYIDHMFKLTVRGDRVDVLALSLFMGAVIAQKTYTMLLYAVAEARFVSFGTAIISALGIGAAALSSRWLPAVRVIDLLFVSVGLGVPVVLMIGAYRYRRAL
jgi:O-antigen/teichoic acid export membrane protein